MFECTHTYEKSQSVDGIIIEFYQQFWDLLKDLLIDMFNECYDLGSLPDSMRTAIISLIFKKGDQENLDNYRPISLTNTDYRILAFTLAERIQQVISKLINTDQVAYIRERFIGNNVRLISDVIENP